MRTRAFLLPTLVLLTVAAAPEPSAPVPEAMRGAGELERGEGQTVQEWETLARQAEIRRTEGGIPHIRAETMGAAGFALAWVQMEDHGIDVVDRLLRARGDMARHYGSGAGVTTDARNRRSRERAGAVFHRLPEDVRAVYQGFAVGVNRFLELHPEDGPPSLDPNFTGPDILARDVGGPAWGMASSFVDGLATASGEDREGARGPLPPEGDASGEPGSNTWALGPSRTASGHAILMRNPHLSWTAGYYEAQVTVRGELNFYGDFRIGGPFTTIGGWNEALGWSTTNNNPRVDDIYVLAADPSRPDHVLFDGGSVSLERKETVVEVLEEEGVEEETVVTWESPIGPVIHRAPGVVYVIRSAGDLGYRGGEQLLRKMQAASLEEWKEAMRIPGRTRSNLAYADRDGNILYVWNALHPMRPHPHGGDSIAIPARSWDDVWEEYLPFDSLPQLLNPEGGYVRNENDPFHHTNLNEVLRPEDYPAEFPEPRLRLRSQHSLEILHNEDLFSLEEVADRKHSLRMLLAERVLPDLLEILVAAGVDESGGELAEAVALLQEWDRTVAPDARGAVLFETWWSRYLEGAGRTSSTPGSAGFPADPDALFREPWDFDRPLETPRGLADAARALDALEGAVRATRDRWGRVDVSWGEVHRARHGRLDLPAGGCGGELGCFRVLWFSGDEDGRRRVTGGDGWVSAVEFGPVPRAYTGLAYGQSIRPDSPHHEDQLRDFMEHRLTPVAFTEEAIEAALLEQYRPGLQSRWTLPAGADREPR